MNEQISGNVLSNEQMSPEVAEKEQTFAIEMILLK
jgi:hypothetical protein